MQDLAKRKKQKAIESAIKALQEHSKLNRKEEQLMYGLFSDDPRSLIDQFGGGDSPAVHH